MRSLTPITDPHNCGRTRPNLAGRRFGRLVAIREAGRVGKRIYWECQCDCGGMKVTLADSLIYGSTRSCNCLAIRKPGEAAAHNLFLIRRRDAAARNYSFELTEAEWYTLTQQPCFYCGLPPCQSHNMSSYNGAFIYNGVDRKDNEVGYTLANSVPCCKQCNISKKAQPYDVFVAWLDRIAAYRGGA